jgi:glutathione S-transferase
MAVELLGYAYSVYSWIVRLALHEKGVDYTWVEINPFAANVPKSYLDVHPFKRVPALVDGAFTVYETNAITRYVDEAFAGPTLQRTNARERARCNQILSIVDSYAYWPLVRQVFSHGVFRPRLRRRADDREIARGLAAAPRILAALESIAAGRQFLCGDDLSLADIHLAPMIGYFVLNSQGRALVDRHPRLGNWWLGMSQRAAYLATMPKLAPASGPGEPEG